MKVLKTAELKLWVYSGDIRLVPEKPNYVLKKTKLSGDTTIVFEIAELIKDFIEIKFDGDYATIIQSMWTYYEVERTYEDNEIDTDGDGVGDLTTTSYEQYAIAFRGYGENTDGINPELSKDLLMSNTVIQKKCGETTSFPLYVEPNEGVAKIEYYQHGTPITTEETITTIGDFTIAQSLIINPSLDTVVTIDRTATENTDSNTLTVIPEIPRDATEVRYTKHDGTIGIIPIICNEECKNRSYKVSFINKFGVMQDIWFTAKRTDGMSSSREQYKRTKLDTSDGVNYSISAHQNVYLENQGKERIKMNTGFIHHSYNEVIKQLLVSEYVFVQDTIRRSPTNPSEFLAIPLNLASSDVQIRTRRDDKLIEYTLEFEADSDFIQSVR
jgi:hypothetical protein